jgi:hypothetical protein
MPTTGAGPLSLADRTRERDIYWAHSFPLCRPLILEQNEREREASEKEKGTGAGLMIDAAASAAWLLTLKGRAMKKRRGPAETFGKFGGIRLRSGRS